MDERGDGLIVFAGVILGLAGIMKIFDAIWAFRFHGALQDNLEGAVFGTNLRTYAWIDLAVALLLLLAAGSVMKGGSFGRWIGITGAVVAGITAMWWMPFYPIWSMTYIGVAVVVIYALAVYGGDRGAHSSS